MAIQIDKSVPLPSKRANGNNRWPFREMEIGDSFALPADTKVANLRNAAENHGSRNGQKFRVLTGPDGVRCWRVA